MYAAIQLVHYTLQDRGARAGASVTVANST